MKNVILEFNSQSLSVISDALLNMPYRIAAPVIDDINEQILQQQQAEEIKTENHAEEREQTHGS